MHYLNVLMIFTGFLFSFYRHDFILQESQDETPELVEIDINHIFGEQIDIHAKFEPGGNINNIVIYIETENKNLLVGETLTPTSFGEIYYIYRLSHYSIRAFSELLIWFKIETLNGIVHTIQPFSYLYDDNRFTWQSITTDEFTVLWYKDDPDIGQKITTTAYEGLSRINTLIKVPSPEGIKIYAYANLSDLQDTLKFSGEATSWVAGHASPDLGIIVISLPNNPEELVEVRRQIPHELAHILLYQKVGTAYTNLPHWLNEGLASISELTSNPNYQILLKKAYEKDMLIPIENLCDGFPTDAANFQLAYAEAFAFTRYLHDTYGLEMMENLIQAYIKDQSCEQAVQATYQQPLSGLEDDWKQAEFSEAPELNFGDETISLMILISFAFIVPIGLIARSIKKR